MASIGRCLWLRAKAAMTALRTISRNTAKNKAAPLRGLLNPHTLRSNNPKLYAAHLSV